MRLQSITGRDAARSTRAIAALAIASFVAGTDPCATARAEGELALGPAPRDADGRFENFESDLPRAGLAVTLPFMLRRMGSRLRDPGPLPARAPVDDAWLAANAWPDEPTVTWIGHATLLVQLDGVNFLTDPIWSDAAGPGGVVGARRWNEPGRTLDELPPIDFVLISHNHYDHLDLPTLAEIARRHPAARFFVPLENAALLRENGVGPTAAVPEGRVVELDWGERWELPPVTIHCLPAQHWSQRGVGDRRKALWASWAVTSPSRRFYFGGDTGYFDRFAAIGRALGPFDLAAVPIGAYLPVEMMRPAHLDPEEAVAAALDLRARRMLGIHWGTFDLADEPAMEPAERFRAAGRAQGVPDDDVWVLDLGGWRRF